MSRGKQSPFVGTQSLSAELPHPFHHSPHHLPLVLPSSVERAGKMPNFMCPGLEGGPRVQLVLLLHYSFPGMNLFCQVMIQSEAAAFSHRLKV